MVLIIFKSASNDSIDYNYKLSVKTRQQIMTALGEILGFRLNQQAEELLVSLVNLEADKDINLVQFSGIGALAERIGRAGISRRDDLEVVDFNLLKRRFSHVDINPSLYRLLTFICKE